MVRQFLSTFAFVFVSIQCIGQIQTYADMGDSVKTWLNERVENAKKGKKEKVQMPFVVRSTGWGCLCPIHYIGVSAGTNDGPWVMPIEPKKFPQNDSLGHSLIVTGYFTGKIVEQDMRNEDGEPEEWLYKIPEFKILSWKENKQDYEVEAPKVIGTYRK
ncbi:MAG TPA: hypothetical protein VK177_15955 [Flavobacteriales bacterium]|nr:hypothetical protein [Flavobacteriales bacterium]